MDYRAPGPPAAGYVAAGRVAGANLPHGGHQGHHGGHAGHGHQGHMGPGIAPAQPGTQIDDQQVLSYVADLQSGDEREGDRLRENAVLELAKGREFLPDLAPLLCHSCGTMSVLVQEIVKIHPYLTSNVPGRNLTHNVAHRACSSLALLQSVASHPDTRPLFVEAKLPLRRLGSDGLPAEH
eukprot:Skav212546  [mRNA]  locus=scaffold1851:606896:607533:+ [translate_table: standard]